MATDVFLLESKVGPVSYQGDGTVQDRPRVAKTGEAVFASAKACYSEAASRGQVYMASGQAEVTFGTALTATAVTFTLYNRIGSLVDLHVLSCGLTIRTCTISGHIVYAANVVTTAAAPATNTELVVRNAKLGGAAGYGIAYSVTTLPAAPVAIRTLATGFFVGTTPAIVFGNTIRDYVDGAIVLVPNTAVTIQGITVAGTGIIDMSWMEVPNS